VPETAPPPGSRPLAGIRVLDLSRVLSGPHAARMLADLGAEIVKVEPPAGDTTRFATPKINGVTSYYAQQNSGKRNVSLDMNVPAAKEILLALAEQCDVLIENFRPGVAARMGIGYDAVAARNPRIVYASISGYGQTGPWAGRKAYASVVAAETGYVDYQAAGRGGVAANDPFSHADVYTGMSCCAGILAALFQRERTGRGEHLDLSMGQVMLYVNDHAHDLLWDGPVDPEWIRSFGAADYPVLTVANGDRVIAAGHPAENGSFQRFMRAAGRDDLIDDPRLATQLQRKEHVGEILDALRAWAATVPDGDAAEGALTDAGMAAGQVRTLREVCDTDWAAAREVTTAVSDRGGGTIRIPNSPWRFAGSDHGIVGSPRYRGEDNREVLSELLGYDGETLDRLEADGVLASRVPAGATD
jgi:CoA:oxalate CoA-transferase